MLKLPHSSTKPPPTTITLPCELRTKAGFLPRDATQRAVMKQYVFCPSVRLSVLPSVTFKYRDHIG